MSAAENPAPRKDPLAFYLDKAVPDAWKAVGGLAAAVRTAAEEAGVLMPSGCRMGICLGCVLPLRSGSVRDLRNGEITTATEGETANGGIRIQTCINEAAGACEIDH